MKFSIAFSFMLLASLATASPRYYRVLDPAIVQRAPQDSGATDDSGDTGGNLGQSTVNSGVIHYGAMWRGTVPCSVRGASRYNCYGSTQANPYTRGCSRITRCRPASTNSTEATTSVSSILESCCVACLFHTFHCR
ncbi:RALF domain-containing protein [Pyrenophora tritici-repentis]|uniref:Uncharacterized protein n=1 Tax=Pyrenophora tritici-repentis TaxID=45151 RepID=A0A5M9KRC4_9PLEO|nr:RALF domain-containing protein [Pyrenophora tritici-repentis]KAF7445619.1 RALF domain containing protein [Pyrenophora tritici-repentis]KAF7565911.1 hypothetical protein PtrM4_053450 [Pyrenophora tritici-repentis]KAI0572778.1 RALF domain-containing protein [Pyrenophora tritici-repentis]KAI0576193.1 RALF domain-containing protein [Pyrenophora tritici-repentis]